MSRVGVCTTFSPRGYQLYGKQFISTFTEFWPEDIPLWVFVEGKSLTEDVVGYSQVETVDLNMDQERDQFLAHCSEHHLEHANNYRRQPRKFCHKVFAMTTEVYRNYEWWLFIDADVVTHAPVTDWWLDELLSPKADVLYLGRPDGKHSETGFMGFHTANRPARLFLREMRNYYTNHKLFELPQWHDSMVFDALRKEFPNYRYRNLSKKRSGHVWPFSILATVMKHNKGPQRKLDAYGDSH